MYKKESCSINVLRAFAALLIINSHFDAIYPVAALATGGAIGNALFFSISGFCLYPIMQRLGTWLPNKLIKLYIPASIMSVVAIFTYLRGKYSVVEFLRIAVWPTLFWFVGAIVLFYPLYYMLKNVHSNRAFLVLSVVLAVIYILYYIFLLDKSYWVIEATGLTSIEGCFKLIYYFGAMMIGKWIRINIKKIGRSKRYYFVGSALSFASVYILKVAIAIDSRFLPLQFLNQISILFFVYFTLCFFLLNEAKIEKHSNSAEYKILKYISSMTLDLYLVQFLVIYYAAPLIFPLNFIVALIFIFLLAGLLHSISGRIYKKISIHKLS